ncbi:hypothetical protein D9G48_18120 [Escherichia coli]|nr:hypothetical protein [Escherichia coli]MHW62091.1 hypothetical protein [Escherichia coli]
MLISGIAYVSGLQAVHPLASTSHISLCIHHNVENTGCHAATRHLFIDWDLTPLRQCSQYYVGAG